MARTHRRILVAGLLLTTALVASCASPHIDPDQPKSAEIRAFRATHQECNPRMYRTPCQIGPDGRLYRYNPGEHD
ncbi:MAG TPA: hypothetical protein VKB51_12185 [bacterium]|nr:hypothetical protein [bacterium]